MKNFISKSHLIILSLVFITLQFLSGVVAGQPLSHIDSLFQELVVHADRVPEDSNSVKKYYEYAILCSENEGAWDAEKQPEVCYAGFDMSQRIGYQKGIKDFLYVLKKCFNQNEDLPLIVVRTYPDAVGRDTLRLLHQYRKKLHGGTVDWYRQAFDNYRDRNMYREAGIVSFWNALAYYDTESYNEALRLLSQAGKYLNLASDHQYLLRVALFSGCSFYYSLNYQSALKEFDIAEKECAILQDSSTLALILYNRGETRMAQKEYQLALSDFQRAFQIANLQGDTSSNIFGQLGIARAFFALKQFGQCIQTTKNAIVSAKEKRDKPGEADALFLISSALMESGDKASAADYLRKFVFLRDSLFTAEINEFFSDREFFWINKLGRQETYKAFVDHEREKYFVELKKSKLTLLIIFVLVVVLTLTGLLLYQSNRSRRKANEYLSQLDKTRNLFFSIIAHDLRGPLIATDYVLKPAISHAEENNDLVLVSSLKEIEMQNSRRKLLLDNLLSWAAMQRGSMKCNLQPVVIKPLIEKVVSFCLFAVKQTGSTVIIDQMPDVTLSADPDMMELIMRNLTDNSLKHGGQGIEIKISGVIVGPDFRITFADNGKGMSEDAVKIFNAGSTPDDTGNSRLGLSLIRYFVEQQNGKISLQSTMAGCSFSLSIPLLITDKNIHA